MMTENDGAPTSEDNFVSSLSGFAFCGASKEEAERSISVCDVFYSLGTKFSSHWFLCYPCTIASVNIVYVYDWIFVTKIKDGKSKIFFRHYSFR
jgi:hypothetical protein